MIPLISILSDIRFTILRQFYDTLACKLAQDILKRKKKEKKTKT